MGAVADPQIDGVGAPGQRPPHADAAEGPDADAERMPDSAAEEGSDIAGEDADGVAGAAPVGGEPTSPRRDLLSACPTPSPFSF